LIKITDNNQVVTRYKVSIIAIFLGILFIDFTIAIVRYDNNLSKFEQQNYQQLVEQANKLENKLSQPMNAITSLRDFADYYLNYSSELKINGPKLIQEGDKFHLEKSQHNILERRPHLSANITGIGDITAMSEQLKQELAMASGLTPAFITAKNSSDVTDWFYYVSLSRFVSLYPWISHHNWQYRDLLLTNPFMKKIIQTSDTKDEFFWSTPYLDTAGKGLITGVAKKVFLDEKMVGVVMADLNLARLTDSLNTIEQPQQGYLLIDRNDTLYIHKNNSGEPIKKYMLWQQVVPEGLKHLTYQSLSKQANTENINDWIVQKRQLSANGWLLVKYQASSDFSNQVFDRYFELFIMVFVDALILLIIIYFVTRNTFIKPTLEFITHIEHSAKGDHGMVSPPKGWHHWFYIVEDIFSQNRSLLQQLKDQNTILDSRVNEKTLALSLKNQQHQHDYAILRSVMNAIPDYLISNDQQGKLIGCNLAFEKLVNQQELSLLGTVAGELIDNELGQALLSNRQKTNSSMPKHGFFQVIYTTTHTYELLTTNFVNQDQQILGTIDIIRDVTRQYADNKALATAKDQAENASKAKSQFLANMSHEIRTPINAIQGMYQLLENSDLSTHQRQHLDNAQLASVALLHLVDEVLDLAKIESGKLYVYKQPCSLNQIVNQAAKLNIGKANRKGLTFKIHIAHDVPDNIITDQIRLIQVFTNLLNNAVKFTHQGEISLSIMLSNTEKNAQNIDQKSVRFIVQDNGIGIAKHKQNDLFEAFVQADESMTRSYGGSGLGLSICQKIVRLLGGDITLKSEHNQGSSFTFDLTLEHGENLNYHNNLPKKIRFCSVQQTIPRELSNEINAFDYDYINLANINALTTPHSYQKTLLLVNVAQLTEDFCTSLVACLNELELAAEKNGLLVIYQEDMRDNHAHSIQLLDDKNIDYIICESPYYRYSIEELLVLLANSNKQEYSPNKAPSNLVDSSKIEDLTEKNLAGIRVLLVEDNLVNQLVAKELLFAMQAEVVVAENGQQAIDVLAQQSFDVVLMDIQMPIMDGLTATKKLRADRRYDKLPIIAMTAHARQEDKMSSEAAGMNLHVSKPIQSKVLLSSILEVIDQMVKG
jgi:signal transduction histidine kinase/CheY-like chemotaxis protein